MFSDTDKVFKAFCKGCVETPSLCPLAKNRTASQLEDYIFSALKTIKQNPIAVPIPEAPGGGLIIDYSLVKAIILNSLYDPSSWPATAKLFNTILTGDGDSSQPLPPATDASDSQESIYGIKCSDIRHHTNSFADMVPVLDARQNSSFFAPVSDQLPLKCAQWPIKAKEIYQGDFKVKTKTPVLLLTNTYDPVAPKIGAQNVTAMLQGSVLMEQEGYGVSTVLRHCLNMSANTVCSIVVWPKRLYAPRKSSRPTSSTASFQKSGRSAPSMYPCSLIPMDGMTPSRSCKLQHNPGNPLRTCIFGVVCEISLLDIESYLLVNLECV